MSWSLNAEFWLKCNYEKNLYLNLRKTQENLNRALRVAHCSAGEMVGFNLIKAGADPLHQSAWVINHLLAMIVFVNYSLMVRPGSPGQSAMVQVN